LGTTEDDEPIFKETAFQGEISTDGEAAPIAFCLEAGSDCCLRFEVDPVSPQTFSLALKSQGAPGTTSKEFALTGKSADGKTITSNRMTITGWGHGETGYSMNLNSSVAKITLALDEPVDKPILRLWFRSFKSFRNPVIETPIGNLSVRGKEKNVSPDNMSGSVALEAPSNDPGTDWYEKADDFLKHMHRGLALAHGGRLQTPRLDYIQKSTWEATFFAGEGFKPELPVQYHLDQGPFIKALAERYESAGALPEMLWTALGWMQTGTTFSEVRFLTAMTALEAIVQSELSERRGTSIPKTEFMPLREKINALIAKDKRLSKEVQEIFSRKVAQLNQKTFSEKIHALFDHYAIPKRDFEGDAISSLIRLRNDIVHMGVVSNSDELWPSIILVRELITRILLKEIGFVGQYCCYVGGRHDRDFPGETNYPSHQASGGAADQNGYVTRWRDTISQIVRTLLRGGR